MSNFCPAGIEFDDDDEYDGFDLGNNDCSKKHVGLRTTAVPSTTPVNAPVNAPFSASPFGGFGSSTKRTKLISFPERTKPCMNAATTDPPETMIGGVAPAMTNGHEGTPSPGRLSPRRTPQLVPIDDFRLAVIKNSFNTVDEMIDNGMDVDTIFHSGWTPLMYAASCGHPQTVRLLLERGADPNFHKDQYRVLMSACASTQETESHVLDCVNQLIKRGADINSFDRYHMSPVMYSTREGRATVVKRLIELGVNIDKQDTRGYTALMWATCRGHIRVVHVLLEGGANAELRCCDGSQAVDLAFLQGQTQVEKLLKKFLHGARIEEVDLVTERKTAKVNNVTSTCVYGELELFLSGLDLGMLISTFQHHEVNFSQFLRMTDKDLQLLDIEQVGVRKKILDAIRQTHKLDWKTSSLTSVQYNRQITCAEAIAMLANIKKHASYIGSTVGYISDQIRADKNILLKATEVATVSELCVHNDDAINNVKILFDELVLLRTHLAEVSANTDFTPPDLIVPVKSKKNVRMLSRRSVAALGAVVFVSAVWKRNDIASAFMKLLASYDSLRPLRL